MEKTTESKSEACITIDSYAEGLHELSSYLLNNPELAFNEHKAHDYLTDFLKEKGFSVTPHYGLDTAFRAEYGDGEGVTLGLMCEYDALPGIGHACGHNLIAEAAVAAALGIKGALQNHVKQHGESVGKVVVLGTPAEEGGGGKIFLQEKGAFEAIDVAMMIHPSPQEHPGPDILCRAKVQVTFYGKASHAAAFPWEGVNALDAAVMAYNNVAVLRQQMKPTWRVHGVITNGGAKPNIIPEVSEMLYYVRAPTVPELKTLKKKIDNCFRGAAQATCCEVDVNWDSREYFNLLSNKPLVDLYVSNLRSLGFTDEFDENPLLGSTDMGNVSHIVPSIHPIYNIGDAFNHTREFTDAAGAVKAQESTLLRAKVMAMCAMDIYFNPKCWPEIKDSFSARENP